MHQRRRCVTKAGVTAPPISAVLLQQAHITAWSQRAKGLKMTHTCIVYSVSIYSVCDIEEGSLTEMKTEGKRSLIH